MKRLQSLIVRVKQLLIVNPGLVDNDNALIAEIWKQDLAILDISVNNGISRFLDVYVFKKITSAENIRRTRQLIEETCPQFRGVTYNKRHKKQEDVIDEIKEYKKRPYIYMA